MTEVRRSRLTLLAGALTALAVALVPAAASAAPAFGPCPAAAKAPQNAACATVPVALDHSGRVPGTVNLAISRVPATGAPKRGTLVFLSGGPGEAAVPLTAGVSKLLGEAAAGYDLVFVDQRGTGRSDPVDCPTIDSAADVTRCGELLGDRRPFWTTRETALDVEDVRLALGEPKITLLGVSYGATVAGEYARRFPGSTAGLILDSPTPVEGQDVLASLRQLGLPRVLKEVCFPPSCRDFLTDPTAALRRLVQRLQRRPLRGRVVLTSGRTRTASLTVDDLYNLVASSDTDPILRAELPAAVASGVLGDAAPLLRLLAATGSAETETDPVNEARLLATNCVEGRLPWAPDSPLEPRAKALADFAESTPAEVFAPFGPSVVVRNSLAAECVAWPRTPKPEGVTQRGPAVPVLVLSGREDLRTPLEDARRTASQYPAARVLGVPGVGHSVLVNDPSECARTAVGAFLAGQAVANCVRAETRAVPRAPFIPASVGDLKAAPGLPRAIGRVATAVLVTGLELQRASIINGVATEDGDTVRVPGLRGGTARLGENTATLREFEIIRGVRLTGTVGGRRGALRVVAPGGITGVLLERGDSLRGVIGGRKVVITFDD